jgi:hypothetical protein
MFRSKPIADFPSGADKFGEGVAPNDDDIMIRKLT